MKPRDSIPANASIPRQHPRAEVIAQQRRDIAEQNPGAREIGYVGYRPLQFEHVHHTGYKENPCMVASSPKTKGYDSSMFKPRSRHLRSGAFPALLLVLSAPVALAAQSAGMPAAAPAAHAPSTPVGHATSAAAPTTS